MARRRRRAILEEIERSVELEIRRGIEVEAHLTKIKDIEGTTIKMFSPMIGQRPREIRAGMPLTINEEPVGAEPRSYTVMAGPDPLHPELPHQYFDEERDAWMLIVQQPDDLPIKRRELVRAQMIFPVILTLADSGKEYGEKANTLTMNLSGSGMLLSVDLEDISEIPRNTKVILDFQLPDTLYKLPPIKGTVVRIFKHGEGRRRHAVGVRFDEFERLDAVSRRDKDKERVPNEKDQQTIIRYVLKKQIESQAAEWAAISEEER